MNIFVIDKNTKENLGIIDFIPRKDDRIILNKTWKNLEYKVECVVYEPKEHAVFVFVNIVEPEYSAMLSDIKWK